MKPEPPEPRGLEPLKLLPRYLGSSLLPIHCRWAQAYSAPVSLPMAALKTDHLAWSLLRLCHNPAT